MMPKPYMSTWTCSASLQHDVGQLSPLLLLQFLWCCS
jgi:hypothetical protein